MDADGNGRLELTDGIRVLRWRFTGGPLPAMCVDPRCEVCISIPECPDVCP
jgi:hypothetical protein